MKRCTIKDIAAAAGVSHTAVSLALRNHPKISEATRERVRRLAEQMGYRPDTTLGALVAYRLGLRPANYHETIAWVTSFPTRQGWRLASSYRHYFDGAQKRAAELGFTIDPLWLREPGLTADHVAKRLRARGIRGILVCPLPDQMHALELPWAQVTAVGFGHGLTFPALHKVTCDHFFSVTLTMQALRARAYRRIGMALPFEHDARVRHGWSGAFFTEQNLRPEDPRIPLFISRGDEAADAEAFRRWMEQWRPDAVVTVGYGWIPQWLESHRRIPEELGVSIICSRSPRASWSGIDEIPFQTGVSAMDLLHGQLYRNDLGLPDRPRILLTPPQWVDGQSLRPPPVPAPAGENGG